MPHLTVRDAPVRCVLFPKVGLPSNACARLCGARWRAAARRELANGGSQLAAGMKIALSRVRGALFGLFQP